jgi:hypothetical protein
MQCAFSAPNEVHECDGLRNSWFRKCDGLDHRTHFQGRFYAGHLLCERGSGRHVVGVPAIGCAFWERDPGADDE